MGAISPDEIEFTGLSLKEVMESRLNNGSNKLEFNKENRIWKAFKDVAFEPMFVLLCAASAIYFVSGSIGDGFFLLGAIVLVAAISLFQENRSRNALAKLRQFTQPLQKVLREGKYEEVPSEDIVVGDFLVAEEGTTIAADGQIIHSNDFSVDESILTGESLPVFKDKNEKKSKVFRGTAVTSGLAIVTVTNVGRETELGKIGKSLESIVQEKTPLEQQIGNFVRKMVVVGGIVFAIVWLLNFISSKSILDSLLKALTLAISILPEEIPVAFTSFMALGALRLMRKGIVVKQMKTVETLGSATVICTDKTGTLTENKMELASGFSWPSESTFNPAKDNLKPEQLELIKWAMWASEPIPFDPMEVAIHNTYGKLFKRDERRDHHMIHEYPLDGKPPMMTHIYQTPAGGEIVAAKGAPEAILKLASLSQEEKDRINKSIEAMASLGYRILGVGEGKLIDHEYPIAQQEIPFEFKGLIAFYDPPKENIADVLQHFYTAGIDVKIVTGDNALTTQSIARQVNFKGAEQAISGEELMNLNNAELSEVVKEKFIFSRMFPEAKLRIINALKVNNEVVAMTGDGVNDGPALKAAHIGIAMGQKGSEIAKQASSLILMKDDLAGMVDAVAIGRRIYYNLKKAIRYIISIHIPIILTVFLPLALGWKYPNIFSPVHIIFLELIMGPTCSIIYENEPIEKNIMHRKPRPFTTNFFKGKDLLVSVLQGVLITLGTLTAYVWAVQNQLDEATTRTVVFGVLIFANIFLTLINRSFYYSIFITIKYRNPLVWMIIGITLLITTALFYVEPISHFFEFNKPSIPQLLIMISLGFLSVIWIEVFKKLRRK